MGFRGAISKPRCYSRTRLQPCLGGCLSTQLLNGKEPQQKPRLNPPGKCTFQIRDTSDRSLTEGVETQPCGFRTKAWFPHHQVQPRSNPKSLAPILQILSRDFADKYESYAETPKALHPHGVQMRHHQ